MSSEGTRKLVLFVCTVIFTLSALDTCGSTTARKLTVSDEFNTYRQSVSRLEGEMEGEDTGKDIRFGWLALGRNFQTKYRSYSGINVDGLRGSSLGPRDSLPNITSSENRKSQHNSRRINNGRSNVTNDGHFSRGNDGIGGGETRVEGETKPATLSFNEENPLKPSRNTQWSHDAEAVNPRMDSLIPESGYQSDSSEQAVLTGHWHVPGEFSGQHTASVYQAAESGPFIVCGSDSMTLTANGNEYANLKVGRASDTPLSLSQLPSSCGHTLTVTPQNLVLKTPYDGCFVIKKDDKYILPLLWWESPVNFSCPATAVPALTHPSVLCSPFGMTLHMEGGLDAAEKLQVLLQGKWVPFLSAQCGYRVPGNPGDLIMYVPYKTCGMTDKGGLHFLPLLSGDTGKVFACRAPLLPSAPVVPIHAHYPLTTAPHTHPPKVPPYPPTSESLHDYANLYTYLQAVPPIPPPNPGRTKHAHLPAGSIPRSSVNRASPLIRFGGSPPLPQPSPGSHTQQPPYPICTPFGPTPCIAPLPPTTPLPHPGSHIHQTPYPICTPFGPTPCVSLLPPTTPHPDPGSHAHQPPYPICTPFGPTPCVSPLPLPLPLPDPGSHTHQPPYPICTPFGPTPCIAPLPPITPLPDPGSHIHQTPYPICTPFGPMPCIPPLPPTTPLPGPGSHTHQTPYPICTPFGPTPCVSLLPPTTPHPDPGSHAHQTPYPICTPFGPTPCVSPLPHPGPGSHTHQTPYPICTPFGPMPCIPPLPPTTPHPDPGSHTHQTPYPICTPFGPTPCVSPLPPTTPHPDPGSHIHQTPYPICTPFGPTPCVSPLPPTTPHPDPGSHIHQTPYPICTPFGPTPCVSPLPPTTPHPDPGSHIHQTPYPICTPFGPTPCIPPLPHHHFPDAHMPSLLPHHHHTTAGPSSSVSSSPPSSLSSSSLACGTDEMKATLPSADPLTIEVKGLDNVWKPIGSAAPGCYLLEPMGVKGVKLSSRLPPCDKHTFSPFMVSLPVRFLDVELGQRRVLELQCSYRSPTAPPTSPTTQEGHTTPSKPRTFCSQNSISVELSPGVEWALRVQDVKATGMSGTPENCVHSVSKAQDGQNILTVPFNSCHVSVQGNERRIVVKFRTLSGREGEVPLSCTIIPPSWKQGCAVSVDLQLPCGSGSDQSAECHALGCCFCPLSQTCYYPVDECTADRHIVFTVPASLTDPPLSTSSLFTPGNISCVPQRVTPSVALFKIPLDGCGVHKYDIGHTRVYMVEILNTLYAIGLNYGIITRDSPVRLLVECRFSPSSYVSVGYLVKTPSLGPSIQAQGVFGVQLRIAKDENYTSYHPQYHRPLDLLLGQPLYLEVRLLNPPDSEVVLLVHYCLAYPRSVQSAWVLLYDGCPNQLDVTPNHLPPATPSPLSQTRRFTIRTFQFLSPDTTTYSDQEIYFMCFTEICSPSQGPCVEGCLDSPSPSI